MEYAYKVISFELLKFNGATYGYSAWYASPKETWFKTEDSAKAAIEDYAKGLCELGFPKELTPYMERVELK